jgi:hypothetical protein
MKDEDKQTIGSMACLIVGCTLLGMEFGTTVGIGVYLIVLSFA